MKGSTVLLAVVAGVALSGCVTIDSTNREDRLAAVARVDDQTKLGNLVLGARYSDVRIAAMAKISDPEILRRIAVNDRVEEHLRTEAIRRIEDDNILLAVASNPRVDDSFREQAVLKLSSDDALAEAVHIRTLNVDVRKKLAERIRSSETMADILLDGMVPIDVRKVLSPKVSNESVLLRYAMDSTIPEDERGRAALRLKSGDACERAILSGMISETVQNTISGRLSDDESRLRTVKSPSVALSVRKKLVRAIGDKDIVLGILLDTNLPRSVRDSSTDSLAGDSIRLLEAFRKCKDLTGAMMSIRKLPDDATSSPEDQAKVLSWFQKAEHSSTADAVPAMEFLAGRMTTDASLLYIAEESLRASDSMKETAIARMSDPESLVRVACRSGGRSRLKKRAVLALRDNMDAIRRVFQESKDPGAIVTALGFLSADEVRAPQAQKKLTSWLVSLPEDDDGIDTAVSIIGLLAPEADVDDAPVQQRIAKILASRDTEELRTSVRKLLVDPNSIEDLVVEKYGPNQSLAVWAVDLVASDTELVKAVDRAKDLLVRCRAVSRIRDEREIARIAENNQNSVVRFVAIRRLGKESEDILKRLVRSSDPAISAGAEKSLAAFDPDFVQGVASERKREETRKKEARKRFLQEREELDRADAKREELEDRKRLAFELSPEFENIETLARIRNCRDWGRLKSKGVSVRNRKVSFVGTVTEVETHWFSSDEVWISVDVTGDAFSVCALVRRADDISAGDRVSVSGVFDKMKKSAASLKNASIVHTR